MADGIAARPTTTMASMPLSIMATSSVEAKEKGSEQIKQNEKQLGANEVFEVE